MWTDLSSNTWTVPKTPTCLCCDPDFFLMSDTDWHSFFAEARGALDEETVEELMSHKDAGDREQQLVLQACTTLELWDAATALASTAALAGLALPHNTPTRNSHAM